MTYARSKEFIGERHPVECFHFWFDITGFHEVGHTGHICTYRRTNNVEADSCLNYQKTTYIL